MVVGICPNFVKGKNMEDNSKSVSGKDLFEEVKPKRLSDEIFGQIKGLIFQGKLGPGDRLPPERELANVFKVGRPCLREALNQLSAVGLIEARKKGGYLVRSLTEEMIDPLKAFIEGEMNNLIDFMEVRKMLDIWCAKEAIKKATDEDLQKIGTILESGDHSEFHIAIAEATHNVILHHFISNMHHLLSGISFIKQRRQDNRDSYALQHKKMWEALKNRDEEAAENAISEHIDQFIAYAKNETK
jgi:GntR family transcriptional repressor for pyruvate dehydrogenase complex